MACESHRLHLVSCHPQGFSSLCLEPGKLGRTLARERPFDGPTQRPYRKCAVDDKSIFAIHLVEVVTMFAGEHQSFLERRSNEQPAQQFIDERRRVRQTPGHGSDRRGDGVRPVSCAVLWRVPDSHGRLSRTADGYCKNITRIIAQLDGQFLPQQLQQERRMFTQIDHVEDTACRGPVPYLPLEAGDECRGILEGLPIGLRSHRSVLAVSCQRSLLLFERGQVSGNVLRLPSPLLKRFFECSCLLTHDVDLFRSRFGFWGVSGLSGNLDGLTLLVQLEL